MRISADTIARCCSTTLLSAQQASLYASYHSRAKQPHMKIKMSWASSQRAHNSQSVLRFETLHAVSQSATDRLPSSFVSDPAQTWT